VLRLATRRPERCIGRSDRGRSPRSRFRPTSRSPAFEVGESTVPQTPAGSSVSRRSQVLRTCQNPRSGQPHQPAYPLRFPPRRRTSPPLAGLERCQVPSRLRIPASSGLWTQSAAHRQTSSRHHPVRSSPRARSPSIDQRLRHMTDCNWGRSRVRSADPSPQSKASRSVTGLQAHAQLSRCLTRSEGLPPTTSASLTSDRRLAT